MLQETTIKTTIIAALCEITRGDTFNEVRHQDANTRSWRERGGLSSLVLKEEIYLQVSGRPALLPSSPWSQERQMVVIGGVFHLLWKVRPTESLRKTQCS